MLLLTLTACTSSADGAVSQGGCAAPVPTASPTVVTPGAKVTFTVDYSPVKGCTDLLQDGTAVPARAEGDGIFRDVTVSWSQGGRTTKLVTKDADARNKLTATVTVPPDAKEGPATLGADSADNVIMTVQAR